MNQPCEKERKQDLEIISQELQLTRTILERLECSFARQEAKLDKLMAMLPTAPTELQQSQQPTPSHSSTPFNSHTPSLEYPPSAVFPRAPAMERTVTHQHTPQPMPPHSSTSVHNCLPSLEYPPSAVPLRAPVVENTHLPASASLQGIERFFDDNNGAGNLQGYDLAKPISLDNRLCCTDFNLIDLVYLLHEIYTYQKIRKGMEPWNADYNSKINR